VEVEARVRSSRPGNDAGVSRLGEPVVVDQLRYVLADADANETHLRVGEEAPERGRDGRRVEQLEDEAAGGGAELEDGHLGGRPPAADGLPLAVRPTIRGPPPPRAEEARTLRTHASTAAASRVTVVSIVAQPKRTLRWEVGLEEKWLQVEKAA
jgi:hypothetical protein